MAVENTCKGVEELGLNEIYKNNIIFILCLWVMGKYARLHENKVIKDLLSNLSLTSLVSNILLYN